MLRLSGRCVFVVIVMLAALAMGVDSAVNFPEGYGEPGPSLFPLLISASVLMLGAWLVVTDIKQKNLGRPSSRTFGRVHVLLLTALIAYLLGMPWVGFVPSTLLLLTVLGLLFGFSGLWRPIALSVVTTSGLYLVFFILLKVPLDTI